MNPNQRMTKKGIKKGKKGKKTLGAKIEKVENEQVLSRFKTQSCLTP